MVGYVEGDGGGSANTSTYRLRMLRFPAGVEPLLGVARALAGGVLVLEPPSGLEISPPGPNDSFNVERTRRGPVPPALGGGGAKLLDDKGRDGGAESPDDAVRPSGEGPGPGPGELVCARDGVLDGGGGVAATGSVLGAWNALLDGK